MSFTNPDECIVSLEEDEHVVYEVRKHMFVFYSRTAVLLLFLLIPLFFFPVLNSFFNGVSGGHGGSITLFFYLLWTLGLWVTFYMRWTDYYLDVWVITNKRIFDIEQEGLFHREISVFRLDRLQDVTIEVNGILATFLDYGNILIHTAGESTDFIIKNAAQPLYIKKIIMRQHDAFIDSDKRDNITSQL